MFKRRRSESDADSENAVDESEVEQTDETEVEAVAVSTGAQSGPFDIADAPDDDIARVDLGGVQVPIIDNMQLHLQGHNEDTDSFASAVIVVEEQQSALELMVVAAPRSGEFWPEVMTELEQQIQQAGGNVTPAEGRFGPELRGKVPALDAEGKQSLETARFVGAEGSRWFLRGMLMGNAATDPALGEFFEDIIAACVVDRGERPMAPGDLVPLSPPVGAEIEEEEVVEEEPGAFEDLKPFERGPEITERR